MRKLTAMEIEQLATRRGVRSLPVRNFLGTLGYARSESRELANLYADATSYGWNAATIAAIRRGIELVYGEKPCTRRNTNAQSHAFGLAAVRAVRARNDSC